jgi:chemotaxis protein MotB
MFGGDSVIGEQDLAQSGHASDKQLPAPAPADPATSGAGFERTVKEMEDRLAGRGGESMTSDSAASHIVTRVTDEGLIVEIFDLPDEPLFAPDTAEPTPLAADLAAVIADVFAMAANGVAVNGHVRAYPSVMKVNPDWDLSIARAVAMRKLMEQAGLAPRRVQRTTGLADRKPATANPMEPRNNRIEIILLRDS